MYEEGCQKRINRIVRNPWMQEVMSQLLNDHKSYFLEMVWKALSWFVVWYWAKDLLSMIVYSILEYLG